MIKVVLDTNIFLSASLFGGMGEIIVDLVFKDKLQLNISHDLSEEIFRKLTEFKASENVINKVDRVLTKGFLVNPKIKIRACRDPKDNFLLELAQTSYSDYLITRDKDLLDLKTWKATEIIKPEDFLPLLRKKKLLS